MMNHSFVLSVVLSLCIPLTICSQSTWNGSMDSNWNNPANWIPGVPGPGDNAVINASLNNPIISGIAFIASLEILDDAIVTVNDLLVLSGSNGVGIIVRSGARLDNNKQVRVENTNGDGISIEGEGTLVNHFDAEIKVDGIAGSGIKNLGRFDNQGTIDIAPTTLISSYGIHNSNPTSLSVLSSHGFRNSGTIFIGSNAEIGISGIFNEMNGHFSNFGDGFLSIDSCVRAIDNDAIFLNSNQISIGQSSSAGDYGLFNQDSFTNQANGVILINRVSEFAVYNFSGTMTNQGEVYCGLASGMISDGGLSNQASFKNEAGAFLQIENTGGTGIVNFSPGTFVNDAGIFIGGNDTIGGNGVENQSKFFNNLGAVMGIDNATGAGVVNFNDFTNHGDLKIGTGSDSISNGFYNGGMVLNDANIEIDNTTSDGYIGVDGTFLNKGTLSIGMTAGNIGVDALFIQGSGSFTNDTCAYITLGDNLRNDGMQDMVNDGYIGLFTQEAHTLGLMLNRGVIFDTEETSPFGGPGLVNEGILMMPLTPSTCSEVYFVHDIGMGGLYQINPMVYYDAAAAMPAGMYDEVNNIFTLNSGFFDVGVNEFFFLLDDVNGNCPTTVPWYVNWTTDVITFDGLGGTTSWHDGNNWDLEIIPGPCHQVVIPAPHDVLIAAPLEGLGKTLDVQDGASLETFPGAKMDIKN